MTKKDYELIANVVNDFKASSVDNGNKITQGHIENLVDMLSMKLKQDNPLFQADKFERACLEGKHIRKSISGKV